jgi:hypothetical protein
VQAVRDALAAREHRTITLLNYRKDGSAFWNELALSPVFDASGELTHFVGIQSDVTARVAVEQERERHLAAERAARAEAERRSAGWPCSPRPRRCSPPPSTSTSRWTGCSTSSSR